MRHTDRVTVYAGTARGQVVMPPSKSIAHRALICAALCPRQSISRLSYMPCNEDIDATIDGLRALGVNIDEHFGEDNTRVLMVEGCGGEWSPSTTPLGCRESGSTMRFLLPLCLLSESGRTLTGSERLLDRLYPLPTALTQIRCMGREPSRLVIGEGARLESGTFYFSQTVTSQWTTGLLMALPLLSGDSVIEFACPPESRSYIDMTLAVLARFGVTAAWVDERHLQVKGGQTFCPMDMAVDSDASGAAFFHALRVMQPEQGALNVVSRLSSDVIQGDAVCPRLLDQIKQRASDELPQISLADCPDLGPMLFAAAAVLGGAIFTHTDRLRFKESDRVAAMVEELSKFGARCETSEDNGGTVIIHPLPDGLKIPNDIVHGHNDHRIVMSLAVLSACLDTPSSVTIDDTHAAAKSFPDFFDRLRSLGIDCRKS
jgi:3-phosphoshikimate 1-carboxyvinyltransferase